MNQSVLQADIKIRAMPSYADTEGRIHPQIINEPYAEDFLYPVVYH